VKSAGFDSEVFEGPARVFDGEQGVMDALEAGTLEKGSSSSSATRAPRAGPACARCSWSRARSRAPARQGRPAAHRRALLRRHDRPVRRPRRPGGHRRRPDRPRGRGRHVRLDLAARRLDLVVDAAELERRAPAGSRSSPATRPACSASTPSSSAPPPRAPSPADVRRGRGRSAAARRPAWRDVERPRCPASGHRRVRCGRPVGRRAVPRTGTAVSVSLTPAAVAHCGPVLSLLVVP
jgi:hypothetical protein